jgi:hypothetical protein
VEAILNNAPLIAPGPEGILGLTISNAMHLSQWTDSWVDIPFDEELFLKHLNKRIEQSTFTKKTVKATETDMSDSF